jgi:hypothetical protein
MYADRLEMPGEDSMFDRSCFRPLLLIGLVASLTSCGTTPSLTSITISPSTMNFGGAGLTTQLTATGSYTHPGHAAETKDITNQVTWASATPQCVTVNSTGLITSGGDVCSNIIVSASAPGFNGTITGTMTVNVTQTGGGGTTPNADITGISILPGSQSVASPNQTSQFIAVGTTSSGATVNVTNAVAWSSSSTAIGTISNTGLATGVNQGTTTITAIYTNADGTIATGTASFTVLGGTSEPITALSIIPNALSVSVSQTAQFTALGTSGKTGLIEDVTTMPELQWTSTTPTVATVAAGLVTGVSQGSATIQGQWINPDGSVVNATGSVTVSATAAPEPLLSINIVPAGITVSNRGMTGQYLAFGTYSTTPTVRDLTNTVTWISTSPEVASINSGGTGGETGGLATAQGYTGSSVIYAEAKNPDGTLVLSNAQTFTCKDPLTGDCDQGTAHPQFATLTIFNAGENTTTWLITAPSDTGTPDLIHCGPGWKGSGGSVCTGTYETGSSVVLTASPTGSGFGGWSSGDGVAGVGCTPAPGKTLLNSPTCSITLNSDTSVGAIFY